MKKRILIAACVILVSAMIVLMLPSDTTPADISTGTTNSTGGTKPTNIVGTSDPSNTTTQPYVPPTTSIVVTPTGTTIITSPPPTTTLPPAPGVVRLYTCDPELQAIYVELAAAYYAETGTEVIILSPEAGRSCEESLTKLLAGENAPTLFCIHSENMLLSLQDSLFDLTGSQAAKQLYSDAFGLRVNGKMLAIAADVEGSGLIFNAESLADVGWSNTDIPNFAALNTVANHITENRTTLGVYAFAALDFSDHAQMQLLAQLYADSDQLRSFVDMYIANTTLKSTAIDYFLRGTTVFYLGGTRDYDMVAALGSNKLGFLPAYADGSNAVRCFCDLYWAVNAASSNADIQATLDFLGYLVTADGETAPVDRLGLLAPYRDATYAADALQRQLRQYISTADARVSWTMRSNVTDLPAFAAALKAYKTNPSDETWNAVAQLMKKV